VPKSRSDEKECVWFEEHFYYEKGEFEYHLLKASAMLQGVGERQFNL